MAVRGGSDLDYKLWFTGEITEDTHCNSPDGIPTKVAILTATSDADFEAIIANPSDYAVKFNDIELPYFVHMHGDDPYAYDAYGWAISENEPRPALGIVKYVAEGAISATSSTSCDFAGDVNIYVAKK